MRKLGLMWKNGVSFLLALSFLLLLTTSFIGCSKSDDAVVGSATPAFSAATISGFTAAVDFAFVNDPTASPTASVAKADVPLINERVNSFALVGPVTHKRGLSVAVYKDGYQMWTDAKGFADGGTDWSIDALTGTAMTTTTPTFAYSITKTFVSALVLTQIEAGLYSLTDTVDSLLGSNADYLALSVGQQALINKTATVAQLLTHTSGMLDYAGNLTAEIGMCNPDTTTWKPADILEHVVYQALVAPGTFHYSNTNYVLLGMIAQQMDPSHRTLNTLLAANFFTPLGITAILAPQDVFPPAGIAHPYENLAVLGGSGFADFSIILPLAYSGPPPYNIYLGIGRSTWAAGGIITTAANLAKWGYELYDQDGSAITDAVRATLKNSATTDGAYGYGINYNNFTYTDSTIGGEYSHGGSAPGYKTLLVYEKTKGITVAIITNVNNSADGTGLINQWHLAEAIFNAYKE